VASATGSSSGGKRRRTSRSLCNGRRRRRTEDLALQVGAIESTVREQFISKISNQVSRTLAFDVSLSSVEEIVQSTYSPMAPTSTPDNDRYSLDRYSEDDWSIVVGDEEIEEEEELIPDTDVRALGGVQGIPITCNGARGVRIFDSANSNLRKDKKFDSNSIRTNSNSNCHFAIRFARIDIARICS
jgi:hypothetical protein